MKIQIYAPDKQQAAYYAAGMNLALRHWEYAGESNFAPRETWANVGAVMDHLRHLEWRMEGLEG